MPGTVQVIYASCLIPASKDKAKQANVVDIILPILQKMGLREVQKTVQDCTARNQQSQLGNPVLPLPDTCILFLASSLCGPQQVVLSRLQASPL